MKIKIGLVSLGCAKNQVDSEQVLGMLNDSGFEIVSSPSIADVIIVNTCGFISSSKEESIDTILEMAKYNKKLIVIGCLVERYLDELKKELPEVDLFVPIREYHLLKDKINQVWAKIYNELGTINEKYINKNISIDDDFVSAHLTIYRRSENTTFSIKGTEEKLFQMFCQNPEKFPINERSNLEEWNKFSDEEKDSKGREENLTKDKIQNYINSLQKFCSAWVKIINFCEIKDENIKKCLMLDSSKELKILLTTLCMKKNTDEVLGELSKVLFRQNLPTEWNRTWDFATLAYYFNNQDKSILYEGENYTIDLIFLNTEFKTIIEEKLDLKSISDGFKNYYTSGKGAAGFYKWKSIKYFLYEYDKQLRGRRNCCDIPYEDIEVEHIIPQNPNYWPDFQINNRISRNVMINTLGNLTILDNSKNSRISNSNWENKKVAYSTDSTRSEKEILEISNNDNWNLSCIRRRGEKMFKYLIEIITQYGNGDGGNNWKQYDFDPVKTKILYYDGNRKRRYDS